MTSTDELLASIAEQTGGLPVHYGVRLWESDDEDLVVLGHHPRRRLLAACRALVRTQYADDRYLRKLYLRALARASVYEMWVKWDPDAEALPYTAPDTIGAVPITEVYL